VSTLGPDILFGAGELLAALGCLLCIRALCRESYRRGRWHGLNEARVDMQIERGHAERRRRDALGRFSERRSYGTFVPRSRL
jgi:hypothetical protein